MYLYNQIKTYFWFEKNIFVGQLFTHNFWNFEQSLYFACKKVEKLKILCDYIDWYLLMIYCLVFINWLMIDVNHKIKARVYLHTQGEGEILSCNKIILLDFSIHMNSCKNYLSILQ